MNWPRFIAVLLLSVTVSGSIAAHRSHTHAHRHARVSIAVGLPVSAWYDDAPAWHPYSYGHAYRYAYRPVVVLPLPLVYIEQNPQNASASTAGEQREHWWYYCPRAQGYYPYVKECPQGWQRVAPQPSDLR